jgi:hypothetical protein
MSLSNKDSKREPAAMTKRSVCCSNCSENILTAVVFPTCLAPLNIKGFLFFQTWKRLKKQKAFPSIMSEGFSVMLPDQGSPIAIGINFSPWSDSVKYKSLPQYYK